MVSVVLGREVRLLFNEIHSLIRDSFSSRCADFSAAGKSGLSPRCVKMDDVSSCESL
jgi:hypothetical protein